MFPCNSCCFSATVVVCRTPQYQKKDSILSITLMTENTNIFKNIATIKIITSSQLCFLLRREVQHGFSCTFTLFLTISEWIIINFKYSLKQTTVVKWKIFRKNSSTNLYAVYNLVLNNLLIWVMWLQINK